MDDATLVLAVWGAVTGTVATIGGIVAFARDRSMLEASQLIEYRVAGDNSTAKLVLHVVNNGRQPVTVFDAGFSDNWTKERRWLLLRREVPVTRNLEAESPEFPVRLDAGDPLTITLDLVKPNYAYYPDGVLQGFAADTRKNLVLAQPKFSRSHYDEVLQAIGAEDR